MKPHAVAMRAAGLALGLAMALVLPWAQARPASDEAVEAVEAVEAGEAASSPARPAAPALREEVRVIPVTVKDLYGRTETVSIPVTIFRPEGAGPFPLVIMNHGRSPTARRAAQKRQAFLPFSRYMVDKGFAVMLPTRVGYADTYGGFDPEDNGGCQRMVLEPQAQAVSDQVLATLAFAGTLPDIDASRWIVAGQSVGGLTAVATSWRHPPGLVGAINFAGGTGGDPDHSPGRPCQPRRIETLWGEKAAESRIPELWLYWENDEYWGPDNPKRWAEAWNRGGGQAEFHQLAPVGRRGHGAMNVDREHWEPFVDAYLARLGFTGPARP